MPLSVLSVAYPFATTGPHAVGGSEQILSAIDQALVTAGHTSLVVACEGSEVAGELFTAPLPQGKLDDADRLWNRKQFEAAIQRALSSQRVDLIHMHGLNFHEYKVPPHVPVLVTLHMPIGWYPQEIWKRFGSNVHFQCVSESQRRSCPPEMGEITVVPNGVALPPFSAAAGGPKENFALALGRICPEKNMHAALRAGSLAGTRVLLGGQVFPYRTHEEYFHQCVEPLLGGSLGHEFLGPLFAEKRLQLLAKAKCLLHPTLAPETSSLVAMEALAAGTPVIAYRSGALPEIIDDGVTGFLVNDEQEMAEAMRKLRTIAPEACRKTAEQRFSQDRMLRSYFDLYARLLDTARSMQRYA